MDSDYDLKLTTGMTVHISKQPYTKHEIVSTHLPVVQITIGSEYDRLTKEDKL